MIVGRWLAKATEDGKIKLSEVFELVGELAAGIGLEIEYDVESDEIDTKIGEGKEKAARERKS
jgi:hypothetical protein